MENIELIISLASAAGSLLVACAAFVVKFIKSLRAKKTAEGRLALSGILTGLVETAEAIGGLSGEEKLGFVLDSASSYAASRGLEFDTSEVKEKVEDLITLTKQVNI